MFSILAILFWLAVTLFYLYASWRIFEKAGRQGWEGIIPYYNWFVLLELTGKPTWWLLLMIFLPPIGLVLLIMVYIDLAQLFGKSFAFGLGLGLFSFIFLPILAFGDATFKGAKDYSNTGVVDSNF